MKGFERKDEYFKMEVSHTLTLQILNVKGKSTERIGEKLHTCSVCGQGFSRSSGLSHHNCSRTGKKPCKYGDCGKGLNYPRVHIGERPCPDCGNCCKCSAKLIIHQRVHTDERSLRCSHCGTGFKRSSELIVHQRVHTGERPFTYSDSGKNFIHSSTLLRHQQVHTEERAFTCSECGKEFTQSSNLLKHQGVHK
ncbi:zinc finger protein 3-like [Heterodontus francisci]|uniref:zinc finger protein 3-like n=1 Tax=Heterodontus francisci TaxID=7792 RepID=UPI00355C16E6